MGNAKGRPCRWMRAFCPGCRLHLHAIGDHARKGTHVECPVCKRLAEIGASGNCPLAGSKVGQLVQVSFGPTGRMNARNVL